ncbi:hypothetical protein OTB20_41945, partial [Streptomyces sp. H27-H1]|nr:hypothetical protein [Streptomyces sp. H27-H1]
MKSLIAVVREQDEAAHFLAWPGDFDLDRGDHVEEVHLASGAALEGFAGDGAGGTYFFCGEGGEERPVVEVIPVVWTHLTMDLVDPGRCRPRGKALEVQCGVPVRRDRVVA